MYSFTNSIEDGWDEEAIKQQVKAAESYAQEDAARVKMADQQVKDEQNTFDQNMQAVNSDGKLKTGFDTKDPKEFGLKENTQEATNAVVGGLQDVANSVAAIPQKIVDPRFYQTSEGPYRPAWLPFNPDDQPINRTVWGKFLRGAVEFGGLMALTRKAAGGATKLTGTSNALGKGLNYVAKGSPVVKGQPLRNLGKTIVHGAVTGAPADLVSSYATESNMAADLIKLRPDWEDALKPFATHEQMSPAQRSLYNMFEGFGAGPVIDIAASGAGALIRAAGRTMPNTRPVQQTTGPVVQHENDGFFGRMREVAQKQLDLKVTAGAEREAEKAFTADPSVNKPWQSMTPEEQYAAKQAYASRSGLEWGDDTNPALKRQISQDANETDVAVNRIQQDPNGERGFDPYVNEGGDVHQGRATSTAKSIVDTLESTHLQSTRWSELDGTPVNFITKNELERINKTSGGAPITQEDYMRRVDRDPAFRQAVEELRTSRKSIDTLAPQVMQEFNEVLAGRKTVASMSEDEFKNLFSNTTNTYEGFDYYSDIDHLKSAVLTSVLNREIRDFARAQKSIMDHVDPLAKDGTLDQILDRYTAIGIGLKQSRYLRSTALSNLKYLNGESTVKPPTKVEIQQRLAETADGQRNVTELIKEAIASDPTDDLLKLITDAFSTNDKLSTWQDLDTFFSNKLMGFKDGNTRQQGAIREELGSLIIHSTISGPKTPVRAAFGTGLATFLRPVQTAIGASIKGDKRSMRGAWAAMNGMLESVTDASKIFSAQLKSNFGGNELPDLNTVATNYTRTQSDNDWAALGEWVHSRGSDAHQAVYGWANMLRNLNHNPVLTWSSKVMSATDMAFHHMIGRARLRELAYHKAYDSLADSGRIVDDSALPDLVQRYEAAFTDEIFDQNGMLTDQLAKYAASEVSMTKDIPQLVERLEQAFAAHPFTKPFMMFTRTGYNALELTGKHVPFINKYISEVSDIKKLPTGHPDLMKYGITTVDEHEAAKALIAGREAMGAAVIFSAVGLYMSGRLTGNGPEDKTLRDARMQQGWVPRSILIGDKYVSYDSLEPFNSFLAFVADVGDTQMQMGDSFTEKMIGQAWYLLQANITNKSFMFGLSQLSEVLGARDADKLGTVAAGIVNSYVPMSSMRNEIGKYFNPGMRELESGFKDSIKNRNLWAGELAELPYKYDVLNGQPLKMYDWGTRTWNAVMPFQINLGPTPTRELLWRSLYDVKVSVNTNPESGKVPGPLRSKWQYLIGQQNIEAKLEKLFSNRQILDSIQVMEADRDAGKPRDPSTYLHNEEIDRIFREAKAVAWAQLSQDTEAAGLIQRNSIDNALANMRKRGQYNNANQLEQRILQPIHGK
jgi:hypothetical protein